jgi:hypothetical protein
LSFWLVLLLGLVAGCAPKIGDHCSVSTDCSANGDRLCDTTQPGGYCTVFNCEPNSCPNEAVCVAFNEKSCPDRGGQATAQSIRFQRTFCMVTCGGDGDCRGGYTCLDTSNDPARQVVDQNPSSLKICTVPPAVTQPDAAPPPDAPPPAVCSPSDATFGTNPSSDAGSESNASLVDVSLETSSDGPAEAAPDAADASSEPLPDGPDEGSPESSDEADAASDGAGD